MRKVLVAVLLAGCGEATFDGTVAWRSFPFDGERTWEFVADGQASPFQVDARILVDAGATITSVGNAYVVEHAKRCATVSADCIDQEVIRTVEWSSTPAGVYIHGIFADDDFDTFDPPIQLSAGSVLVGDVWETRTAGALWTSTYGGQESCPTRFAGALAQCFRYDLTTTGADRGLAGSYWAAPGINVAAFELAIDGTRWVYGTSECVGDCDGSW